VNQEEFNHIVEGFMDLVTHVRNFPFHVIRAGFHQNAIAGPDERYLELMRDALNTMEVAQRSMLTISEEMKARYGTSPPEVSTGPSAVGTRRKERVDASGFKLVKGEGDGNPSNTGNDVRAVGRGTQEGGEDGGTGTGTPAA
jgi:hypothetical protein